MLYNMILDELWNRLLHLSSEDHVTRLTVNPLIFGERLDPTTHGSLINLKNDNFTLSELFSGFSKGLVSNLLRYVKLKIVQFKK